MSKQSEAKKAQNYRKELSRCGNCANFSCEVVEKVYEGIMGKQVWEEKKNKRCLIGGFAAAENSVCDNWKKKEV
jgi:hypothetical protein